jgi:hypothetical protein
LLNFFNFHLFLCFICINPPWLIYDPHLRGRWYLFGAVLLEIFLILSLIEVFITSLSIFAPSLLLTLTSLAL